MDATLSVWNRLRADRSGVVSFEYVIVTSAVIAAAAMAFGTNGAVNITDVLTNGISTVTAAVTALFGGG